MTRKRSATVQANDLIVDRGRMRTRSQKVDKVFNQEVELSTPVQAVPPSWINDNEMVGKKLCHPPSKSPIKKKRSRSVHFPIEIAEVIVYGPLEPTVSVGMKKILDKKVPDPDAKRRRNDGKSSVRVSFTSLAANKDPHIASSSLEVAPVPTAPENAVCQSFLPLKDQRVVLDIKKMTKKREMVALITRFGGTREEYVSEDSAPHLVVSDNKMAKTPSKSPIEKKRSRSVHEVELSTPVQAVPPSWINDNEMVGKKLCHPPSKCPIEKKRSRSVHFPIGMPEHKDDASDVVDEMVVDRRRMRTRSQKVDKVFNQEVELSTPVQAVPPSWINDNEMVGKKLCHPPSKSPIEKKRSRSVHFPIGMPEVIVCGPLDPTASVGMTKILNKKVPDPDAKRRRNDGKSSVRVSFTSLAANKDPHIASSSLGVAPVPTAPENAVCQSFLPLKDQRVVLDIKKMTKKREMVALITRFGGTREEYVSEDSAPHLVVSDNKMAKTPSKSPIEKKRSRSVHEVELSTPVQAVPPSWINDNEMVGKKLCHPPSKCPIEKKRSRSVHFPIGMPEHKDDASDVVDEMVVDRRRMRTRSQKVDKVFNQEVELSTPVQAVPPSWINDNEMVGKKLCHPPSKCPIEKKRSRSVHFPIGMPEHKDDASDVVDEMVVDRRRMRTRSQKVDKVFNQEVELSTPVQAVPPSWINDNEMVGKKLCHPPSKSPIEKKRSRSVHFPIGMPEVIVCGPLDPTASVGMTKILNKKVPDPDAKRRRNDGKSSVRVSFTSLAANKDPHIASSSLEVAPVSTAPENAVCQSFLPLKDQRVVLDIKNMTKKREMVALITRFGGTIEEYVSEDSAPHLVVSDNKMAKILQEHKDEASDVVDEMMLTMLPTMLKNAVLSKVRVRHVDEFEESAATALRQVLGSRASYDIMSEIKKTDLLTGAFIKIEDYSQMYRPLFKQFKHAGKFYFGQFMGASLFHKGTPEQQDKRRLQIEHDKLLQERLDAMELDGDDGYLPSTLPPPEAPTVKEVLKGYCEICNKHTRNVKKHLVSEEHRNIVNAPGFYSEVDALLGSCVEEIDCPGFPRWTEEDPCLKKPDQ